jgi:hypothetical protein
MPKKRAFISFDYDNDGDHKVMLAGQTKHDDTIANLPCSDRDTTGSARDFLSHESKLHSDFAHLQLKDQWFHATKELWDFIHRELGLQFAVSEK